MKRMKPIKALLAMILALTMVLGMSMTTFAAIEPATDEPSATITITGMPTDTDFTATITLYQVADGGYDATFENFTGYTWATGISNEIIAEAQTGIGAESIMAIVNGIKDGSVTPLTDSPLVVAFDNSTAAKAGTFSYEVGAGAYIALITEANDAAVYSPVFLAASYDANGTLTDGTVDLNSTSLNGTSAETKRTEPQAPKTITDGATPDGDYNTASLGDVIEYTVSPELPTYPANAVNKTLFLSDRMSDGLTFDSSSLTININGESIKATDGTFTYNNKIIAEVYTEGLNGFNLTLNHDNLLNPNTNSVYDFTVTYSAIVNENAVVGSNGNDNTVTLYYANDPSTGSTFETEDPKGTPDDPDGDGDDTDDEGNPEMAEGVTKKEDQEVVYTYQVALKKVDEEDTTKTLAGAVFGVYRKATAEGEADTLVDVVTTNDSGYAISTKVAAGNYYFQEIVAPVGYTLNTTKYDVTADWTSATYTTTAEVTEFTYTTNVDDAVSDEQVGWIKDNTFYAMDEFTAGDTGVSAAYVSATATTTTAATTIDTNTSAAGAGTAFVDNIPNTQMSALPSTGGVGTIIFTIVGCLVMVASAALFITSRRKENE